MNTQGVNFQLPTRGQTSPAVDNDKVGQPGAGDNGAVEFASTRPPLIQPGFPGAPGPPRSSEVAALPVDARFSVTWGRRTVSAQIAVNVADADPHGDLQRRKGNRPGHGGGTPDR
jgi:hypothetical protein